MTIRVSWNDLVYFEIHSAIRQGCALTPSLFNYSIDWILGQALQNYSGVYVIINVHVSGLTDDIVILSSSYWEIQDLLEAVNRHATNCLLSAEFVCMLGFSNDWFWFLSKYRLAVLNSLCSGIVIGQMKHGDTMGQNRCP